MKPTHQLAKAFLLFLIILTSCQPAEKQKEVATDPLPSWNKGSTRQAILDFVSRVTSEGSPDFIPVADRIATFDNDGTLWTERPYVQELFASFRIKQMLEKNPSLKNTEPFKTVLAGDKEAMAKGGEKFLLELLVATHTGMTESEFDQSVRDFFATATYPGWNVPMRQVRYLPQLELMDYLRSKGFKVYICTGGTVEFVRGISESFYGVPPEQVIATSFKYTFVDSTRGIYRLPQLNHFNDKTGKPPAIQLLIGKHPVVACGNEGGYGDIAMLKFSQAGKYPSLQLLVNHDDGEREHAYHEPDSLSLKAAATNGWKVISIKNDWKQVFAAQ